MVLPPGEQHGVGGGLRSLTAFLVLSVLVAREAARICIIKSKGSFGAGNEIRSVGASVACYGLLVNISAFWRKIWSICESKILRHLAVLWHLYRLGSGLVGFLTCMCQRPAIVDYFAFQLSSHSE